MPKHGENETDSDEDSNNEMNNNNKILLAGSNMHLFFPPGPNHAFGWVTSKPPNRPPRRFEGSRKVPRRSPKGSPQMPSPQHPSRPPNLQSSDFRGPPNGLQNGPPNGPQMIPNGRQIDPHSLNFYIIPSLLPYNLILALTGHNLIFPKRP